MPFLAPGERAFLSAVSRLAFANPFLPERVALEREALGTDFVADEPVWSVDVDDPERTRANVWRVVERLEPLAGDLRGRLASGTEARGEDLTLYEDSVLHLLYQRYYQDFHEAAVKDRKAARWNFYQRFARDWERFFRIPGVRLPAGPEPVHLFACYHQIQRAFHHIFTNIIGGSLPAARLRAAVWESIFTHDIRRYRRALYARMGDFATLITGPSGAGKELVASAIAHSRYSPFDAGRLAFADDGLDVFHPINIAALSPTLVESELFGHRRGAFTGAVEDRKGWLEACPPLGSVFLDELGEMDPAIQVKLLRVIETRTFHAVGDTAGRRFHGKLIAATNRNLAAEIRAGRFREDLYYRLCSDLIVVPSLSEQIGDSPGVLRDLIFYMSRRVAGDEAEALRDEVKRWIESELSKDYPWPGNFRELEQCVRNILIHKSYRPAPAPEPEVYFRCGRVTADELLRRYCAQVYAETGSYEETARRLGLDRRTVKAKLE